MNSLSVRTGAPDAERWESRPARWMLEQGRRARRPWGTYALTSPHAHSADAVTTRRAGTALRVALASSAVLLLRQRLPRGPMYSRPGRRRLRRPRGLNRLLAAVPLVEHGDPL